jgi:hypothetical protein
MMRAKLLFPSSVLAATLFLAPAARADCTDSGPDGGACGANEYCALADGGAVLDGSAGKCALEPCVVSADCTDASATFCDTSREPHACVQCITTANCATGTCDTTTHTCVDVDGGPTDASANDAGGGDGGSSDSGVPTLDSGFPPPPLDSGAIFFDANLPDTAPPPFDAGTIPPDVGAELRGGACTCDLAARGTAPAGLVTSALVGLAWLARRRRRRAPQK